MSNDIVKELAQQLGRDDISDIEIAEENNIALFNVGTPGSKVAYAAKLTKDNKHVIKNKVTRL